MNPGKVWVPQGIPDARYGWVFLPEVPTPAQSTPLHTLVPAEKTAWTPRARPVPSVGVRPVPAPEERTVPPALPQNVAVGSILSAPAGSSTGGPCRSRGCLRSHRRVYSAHSSVCGGPRGRAWWRWARHGHSERRGCSLLAALCRPCRVPVPASFPSIRSHRSLNTGTALSALAVSPATGSPSFPHSGFAQRCHILPRSMSPYPLSQEELPRAVSPPLPWAQHPGTGRYCHQLSRAGPATLSPVPCRVQTGLGTHWSPRTCLSTQVTHRRQVGPLVPGPGGQLDVAGHNHTGTCGADRVVLRLLFWV